MTYRQSSRSQHSARKKKASKGKTAKADADRKLRQRTTVKQPSTTTQTCWRNTFHDDNAALPPPSVADRAATQRFHGPRGNRSAKRGSVQTGSAWNRKSRTLRQRRRWQSKRLVRFWHPCAVTTRSGLNLLLAIQITQSHATRHRTTNQPSPLSGGG